MMSSGSGPVRKRLASPAAHLLARTGSNLSPRVIGVVYLWLVIVVVFGAISPSTFLHPGTISTVLNEYAISGIIALAAVIPLASGVFDLSIAYTMGLAGAVSAKLLATTNLSVGVVIAVTLLVGVGVGLVNSLVVVVLRVNPIVGTLGTGFIIGAIETSVDSGESISNRVAGTFQNDIASRSFHGLTEPVWYMIIIMVALGFLMEQTATGRRWYALGFDYETTRLAGVSVRALRSGALILSALVACVAGIAYTAQVGAHSPGDGPEYLLPAFSAVFLGATQVRVGRFNVWGTVLATLMLGTGAYGLLLSGAPAWTANVFQGVALIGSIVVTSIQVKSMAAWWRTLVLRQPRPPGRQERGSGAVDGAQDPAGTDGEASRPPTTARSATWE
jgi:ribose transport system permease protein